ncbi:right-handed parallel beta-helix repeat-containing protein [Streptomyces sp. NBC_01285]|uniref:right-handed parallel beta-helix repeat-containing protein n=1 Tax=unclassified Streptomyces TaxID=2593676 RepID=UPI002253A56A|nr:right-handed parallel beta-helix repeat-containing protein [Streptomyces sp. NBC_01285]MCX4768477.1 right-handed parallel beta-helix repeat-containing protein [Streptomyces sp. NBC_01285]
MELRRRPGTGPGVTARRATGRRGVTPRGGCEAATVLQRVQYGAQQGRRTRQPGPRQDVTVRGLDLWGTSLRTGKDSTGVLVEDLNARYVSEYSTLPMPADDELAIEPGEGHIVVSRILDSGVQLLGTGNTLRDSEIGYSAGTGVLVRGSGNTVTNTYIHDIGWMGSYTPGIEINGSDHTVTHNTVRRTGRGSIDVSWQLNRVPFHNNEIAYNDLSEAMRTSRDGSPFYVCCNLDATGTSVDHNIVHDDDGQVGYYIDNSSGNFLQAGRRGERPFLHPGGRLRARHRPLSADHPHRTRRHRMGCERDPSLRGRAGRRRDAPGRTGHRRPGHHPGRCRHRAAGLR